MQQYPKHPDTGILWRREYQLITYCNGRGSLGALFLETRYRPVLACMFPSIEALPHLQSLRSLRLALRGAQRVSQSATNPSDSLVERSHEFVHSVSLLVNAANDNFTTPNRVFASKVPRLTALLLVTPKLTLVKRDTR